MLVYKQGSDILKRVMWIEGMCEWSIIGAGWNLCDEVMLWTCTALWSHCSCNQSALHVSRHRVNVACLHFLHETVVIFGSYSVLVRWAQSLSCVFLLKTFLILLTVQIASFFCCDSHCRFPYLRALLHFVLNSFVICCTQLIHILE